MFYHVIFVTLYIVFYDINMCTVFGSSHPRMIQMSVSINDLNLIMICLSIVQLCTLYSMATQVFKFLMDVRRHKTIQPNFRTLILTNI